MIPAAMTFRISASIGPLSHRATQDAIKTTAKREGGFDDVRIKGNYIFVHSPGDDHWSRYRLVIVRETH